MFLYGMGIVVDDIVNLMNSLILNFPIYSILLCQFLKTESYETRLVSCLKLNSRLHVLRQN